MFAKKKLGKEHPHTATIYFNIAKLYTTLEQFEEARKFYCKALSIRESAFGPDHPIVARTLEQYNALLDRQKQDK